MKAKAPSPEVGPTQNSNMAELLLGGAPELLDKLSYGDALTRGSGAATQVTGETAGGAMDLLSLLPAAAVAKLLKNGLRAYHGTLMGERAAGGLFGPQVAKQLDGTHLGSLDQAHSRMNTLAGLMGGEELPTGAAVLPVQFRPQKPGWTSDAGDLWDRELQRAKEQGYDSLFYLNGHEGKVIAPSYIPFSGAQLTPAVGKPVSKDERSLNLEILRALLQKDPEVNFDSPRTFGLPKSLQPK